MINRKMMRYLCSNKSDNKHKKLKLIRKHLLFPLAVSLWNGFGCFLKEFVYEHLQNHQQQKGSNSSSNCVNKNNGKIELQTNLINDTYNSVDLDFLQVGSSSSQLSPPELLSVTSESQQLCA